MMHPPVEHYIVDLLKMGYGIQFWQPKDRTNTFRIRLSYSDKMIFREVSYETLQYSLLSLNDLLYLELEDMVREVSLYDSNH